MVFCTLRGQLPPGVAMNIRRLALTLSSCLIAFTAGANSNPGDLLVSGRIDNNVSQYNGATGAFVSTFASTGGIGNPVGIVYGPDRNLYVANVATNSVLRFNGLTGAFIDQ